MTGTNKELHNFVYSKRNPGFAVLIVKCKATGNGVEAVRILLEENGSPSECDEMRIAMEVQTVVTQQCKNLELWKEITGTVDFKQEEYHRQTCKLSDSELCYRSAMCKELGRRRRVETHCLR